MARVSSSLTVIEVFMKRMKTVEVCAGGAVGAAGCRALWLCGDYDDLDAAADDGDERSSLLPIFWSSPVQPM